MAREVFQPAREAVRELRKKLPDVDDGKIRRITALVDGATDPAVNQTVLDPLRERLAVLKPARPLRFARLLFIPIDAIIVPPKEWRQAAVAVPRTVLAVLTRVVRAGLGPDVALIEQALVGCTTEARQVVIEAGAMLWGRAAAILADAACPTDWPMTGLRPAAYAELAPAVAAVLRRAGRLNALARDWGIGALEAEAPAIDDIMRNLASESSLGCAMVMRLILLHSPTAASLLRRFVSAAHSRTDSITLNQAIASGIDEALTHLERGLGAAEDIRRESLPEAAEQLRRAIALLRDIEAEPATAAQHARLRQIRQTLDEACRQRLECEIAAGLVTPIQAASGLMDGAEQCRLEAQARNVRGLEIVARKIGSSAVYDRLLAAATDVVEQATCLKPIRQIRLIELLAGADAAEAVYRKTARGKPIPASG